ncbi:unnamed protein product [Mytilus coruscus]|uniref:Reverse transcriptase/retrotransposon-derived protein RNase H-like domain-containing protein n=1 Tax=Mytilus coruscus TaxID=42192 RepID=A0A6J8CV41_MYTCO|nr:unnamed protein product [Mytilus coruscus]
MADLSQRKIQYQINLSSMPQICRPIEKELQDTFSRSRHSHSTLISEFASDSGIITTQRDDQTSVDKTTLIHSTPVGPRNIGIGARPKVFQDAEASNQLKPQDYKVVKETPVNLSDIEVTRVKRNCRVRNVYKAEKKFEVGKAHLRVVDNSDQIVRESESHDRLSDRKKFMLASFNDQLASMRKDLDEFKNKANMPGPVDRSKFPCFICGKPGHIARNFNAPRNRRQNNQGPPGPSVKRMYNSSGKWKRKSVYIGSNTLNSEAGLYVELLINGTPAKFLVDKGATVSLVSDTLSEKFKSRDRPSVRQVTQEITVANESLKAIGKALCSVSLEAFTRSLKGKLGVYRVAVKDKISIAPRSKVLIRGEVLNYDSAVKINGIIEPSEEFLDREKALVGKSIVSSDKIVSVRLLNVSDRVQVTNACTWSEISAELKLSSESLEQGHKDKVLELLLEFKHLFAASDSGLGQTNIVKHMIDTGAARPIKQPPRRTPIGLMDEVDQRLTIYWRESPQKDNDTAKCLHQMTEEGREFLRTNDSQEAFEKLKGKLVSAQVLGHPDFSQTFILDTDACNRAIGGVVSQVIDGEEHIIAYGSRTLS